MDSHDHSRSWLFQPSYQEGHPGWQSTFDQTRFETHEEKNFTGKLIGLIKSVIDDVRIIRTDHDQMLVDHAERFEALEQDKVRHEKVIEEQAKKIEQLETLVKHEHFWRITMIDTSILDLKGKWRQIDQIMCSRSKETEVCKELIDKSAKEITMLEADMVQTREEQATRLEELEASVKRTERQMKTYHDYHEWKHQRQQRKNEYIDVSIDYLKDNWKNIDCFLCRNFREPWEKHNERVVYSSDDESWDVLPLRPPTQYELNQEQGYTSKKLSTATFDTWEGDGILRDLFEDYMHMDTPLAMNEFTDEPSCDSCGLHCVPQLRACVNMIQVMPEIKKVKKKEIRDLKRTMKRKLQRQWVPRCMFDIKEQFKSDTINFEDKCAKPYMPRWKKRKQRAPTICDSCD